jgi:hypothetical protein
MKLCLGLLLAAPVLLASCFQKAEEADEAGAAGATAGQGGGGAAGGSSSAGAPMLGERITSCAGVEAAVTLLVDADIKQDTTWSGTVVVARPVSVTNAATLTIAAGTSVVMNADSLLMVGDKTAGGALQALGAAEAPIAFCGRQSQKGYWGGLGFGRYARSDSSLNHVSISGGGAGEVALLLDASVHVRDVTVRDTASDGVWASVFGADSARLSIQGNDGAAAVLLGLDAVSTFPLGGQYGQNGEDVARVRFGTIERETHFRNAGLPYLLEQGLLVRDGAKLVFEAGVEARFAADTAFDVGLGNSPAELAVLGTATAPVTFRGALPTPGYWQGLGVGARALTSSRLEHALIRDAGGKDRAALYVDTAATLIDVSLRANAKGMVLGAAGLHPESALLSISGTQGPPLTVAPDALVSLPPQSSFAGNTADQIVVEGGAYTKKGTLTNYGVPYLLSGSIALEDASELTIAPGTKLLMGANTSLEVGARASSAKLVARGTAAAPIEVSGQVPSAGFWGSVIMYASVTSDSSFEYVHMSHGGGSNPKSANLVLSKACSVKNSSFSSSFGHGIVKWKDDPTDYAVGNTFADNASGPIGVY